MNRRFGTATLFLALAGLGTVAHAQNTTSTSEIDRSATLRLVWLGNPGGYDPPFAKNPFQITAYGFPIFDSLVRLNVNGDVVPDLATSWTFSGDGLTLTMQLRGGVKFTDGSDVTAAVIVKNLTRAKSDPASLVARDLGSFESFEAKDPQTVVLRLKTPDANVLYTLATSAGFIVSGKALDENVNLSTTPVGSGPYKLVSSTSQGAVYQRNEDYFDKSQNQFATVNITSVVDVAARLNALLSGQADVGLFQIDAASYPKIESMVKSGEFTVHRFTQPNSLPMWMNTKIKPFDNPKVRMAVNYAINREAINQGIQNGECTLSSQPLPPGVVGHDESLKPYPFDVAKAKALLQEAGVGPITFDAIVAAAEPYSSVALAMKAQLEAIGVTMNINLENSVASRPLFRGGKSPALIFNMSVPAPDPASIIDAVEMSPDNPGGVTPEYAKMIADARTKKIGSPEREAAYKAISRMSYENPHNIFVCWTKLLIVARKDVVGIDKTAYVNAVPIPDIRTYGFRKSSK